VEIGRLIVREMLLVRLRQGAEILALSMAGALLLTVGIDIFLSRECVGETARVAPSSTRSAAFD
jgi:hypothetical protein